MIGASFKRVPAVLSVMKHREVRHRLPAPSIVIRYKHTPERRPNHNTDPNAILLVLSAGIARSIATFHPTAPRSPVPLTQRVKRTHAILIRLRVRNQSNLTSLAALAPFQFPGNLILCVSPNLIIAWEKETGEGGHAGREGIINCAF